jgi:glycosyltransferase involved in cell wall biosynthesis
MIFISWAEDCSRSDGLAKQMGGESYMIYSPFWGSNPYTIVFKYISQSLKTAWVLLKTRPPVIFVMTPPVIACCVVWLYAKLTGARYVIDAHTAAFLYPAWRKIIFLHRFFSRAAATTIVTNPHLEEIVRGWGAHVTLVPDVPILLEEHGTIDLGDGYHMVFVSTFTADEPLELFMAAATRVSDVNFYVTGNIKDCPREIYEARPPNVRFTGFLSKREYAQYINSATAAVCLTTLDHAMQRGAYEAVYAGTPVITSNFEILRTEFDQGAVHVNNEVASIALGIEQMRDNAERYKREAQQLRDKKLNRSSRIMSELAAAFQTH